MAQRLDVLTLKDCGYVVRKTYTARPPTTKPGSEFLSG
jgi:hypothetical protein